jgi:hypothetical protein
MALNNKSPYQVTRTIKYLSDPKHIIHFLNQANIADLDKFRVSTNMCAQTIGKGWSYPKLVDTPKS